MALLDLTDVHTYYGAIHALRGVTLSIDEGEIVTLIGANGAGKSTTLRTISGLLKPRQGQVTFRGQSINGMPPHQIVGLGICQSPEGRRVFARMTVHENLEMGAFSRKRHDRHVERISNACTPSSRDCANGPPSRPGRCPGGEQQMLAIGRALMAAPKILLLDEPSMGLSPILTEQIFQHHHRDQQAGHDGAPGRAERVDGPRRRPSRVHPSDWRDRADW